MTDYIASLQQALRDAAAREYPAAAPLSDSTIRPSGEAIPNQQQRRRPSERLRGRRRDLRGPARWLVPAVTLVAALLVVAVVLSSAGGPSIVARASAAINTKGVVVHYVERVRVEGKRRVGDIEVWTSADQTHVIGNSTGQIDEIVIHGRMAQNYVDGTISTYRLPVEHRCADLSVLLGYCAGNPIAALKTLYHASKLRTTRTSTIDGRRVDLLAGSSGQLSVRAFVNPQTFIPVKITVVDAIPNGRTHLLVTTTISHYRRLPLTPANQRLLLMRHHPHARVVQPCRRTSPCSQAP